jgi:protein O-mannosyl-transferase
VILRHNPAVLRSLARRDLLWMPLVAAGLAIIYLPGLGFPLIFDDSYLADGSLQADFGTPSLRPRLLSYGSFLWLQALFGEGWWKQRVVNLLLHAGVVVSLWALWREILRAIVPAASASDPHAAPQPLQDSPALGLGLALFALNPVAVYAVAYLIQRSIVMATLFVALSLFFFARGLREKKAWMHVASFACYVAAVLSKEHALLAPLAAVPLYVVVARPPARRLALLGIAGAAMIAAFVAAFWPRYGYMLGAPIDEYSKVYIAQLARLSPEAGRHAFGLSILNQAYLFFQYGLRWLLPFEGWMSIAMRPPFPIAWTTFPQVLGIVAYAALVAGGFWLVIRHRDWRALLGISILFPALLFPTELGTVWVQDPFVLYRSYLWAIGLPGLVVFVAHGPSGRVLLAAGLVAGILLVWQALDRVLSMESAESVWSDAIEKLPDDPRAVGRWFPYLNRGSEYVERDRFDLALRDFEHSAALGDLGMGALNMGTLLSAGGKQQEALKAFDEAERQGYALYNLPLQRALAYMALGRAPEAYEHFLRAKRFDPPSPAREAILINLGKLGLQLGRRDEAMANLEQLLRVEPKNREGRYLLGMGYIMKNDAQRALPLLDSLVRDDPNARSYYARALANYGLKRKADALADIQNAMRLDPANAALRDWEAKIRSLP